MPSDVPLRNKTLLSFDEHHCVSDVLVCSFLQVYIDSKGRTLTGSKAYAKAQQDKGLATKPAGHRARSRKSPGKVKHKRKPRAKGSKLPSFRATKSRFG